MEILLLFFTMFLKYLKKSVILRSLSIYNYREQKILNTSISLVSSEPEKPDGT